MPQTRLAWPPVTRNIKFTLLGLLALWVAGVQWTSFVERYMLVSRRAVFVDGHVWTIFTYALWHLDFSHLLFNGFALWMFGGQLDRRWSSKWFWGFCLLCALGGGVAIVVTQLVFATNFPTLGYSGAVMGLAAGFCWHNWDRPLYFFFARMSGKWLLLLFVGIDLFMVLGARQPISISGHLGGMITGLLLVSGYWRPSRLKRAVERWKQKRQFQKHSRTPTDKKWN